MNSVVQEQPNVAAESAKLDAEIESLTKEAEESKADLLRLKIEKKMARERLEQTKKNGNEQQARLMLVKIYFSTFCALSKQMNLSYFLGRSGTNFK